MMHPLQLRRSDGPLDGFIAVSAAHRFDELNAARASFLHPDEERYLAQVKSARRGQSFLLGRHAAKQVAAACLREPNWSQIEVAWGVFGQPLVRHRTAPGPELSIAHTDDAAVAVACAPGHPIGVDLERMAPALDLDEKDVCAAGERELARTAGVARPVDLLLLWTIKEALTKVLRCGLMTPLPLFALETLEASADGTVHAVYRNFPQYRAVAWMLPAHLLAIALPRSTELGFRPDAGFAQELAPSGSAGAIP